MKELVNPNYKDSELTGRIYWLHNARACNFKYGVSRDYYQDALLLKWLNRLTFAREMEMTIYYDGIDVGTRRADFLVEDKINC